MKPCVSLEKKNLNNLKVSSFACRLQRLHGEASGAQQLHEAASAAADAQGCSPWQTWLRFIHAVSLDPCLVAFEGSSSVCMPFRMKII